MQSHETPSQVESIVERLSRGAYAESDIQELSKVIKRVDSSTVQIGQYNVNVGETNSLQIGNHIYQGTSAEAIHNALHEALRLRDEIDRKRRRRLILLGGGIGCPIIIVGCVVAFLIFRSIVGWWFGDERSISNEPTRNLQLLPPYYGVFIQEGDNYISVPQIEGEPEPSTTFPTSPTDSPALILWSPDINLDLLILKRYGLQEDEYVGTDRLDFNVTPRDEGMLEVILQQRLQSGLYCFVQQDIMLPGPYILHFCFHVL